MYITYVLYMIYNSHNPTMIMVVTNKSWRKYAEKYKSWNLSNIDHKV